LQKKFVGFDSVDPRMGRVPLDLREASIRNKYLENHKHWFLHNHENALSDFEKSVESLYPSKPKKPTQMTLLELKEQYKA
jgi:site-specific DNA-methyltransferase (adenine-specific)